jgi:hypothetical protein
MVVIFEKRFPQYEKLLCNSVAEYVAVMEQAALSQKMDNLEDCISDDELEISAAVAIHQHFGASNACCPYGLCCFDLATFRGGVL